MFLFFQLGFGRSANPNDGNATGQFGQTFLEFFAIVIAGGLVDLDPDLIDAAVNSSFVAFAADDGGIVFVSGNFFSAAEVGYGGGFQFAAGLFRDHGGAGQGCNIAQHCFAAIAKARSLDGQNVQHTTQFIEDQGRQSFAVDVFGNDDQVAFANLHHFLQQRHNILRSGDFLVIDQDVRFRDDGFHVLGVGHEVGRNITAVELHTFNVLGLELEALGFFDGDDAVFTHFVHHFSDQGTNGGVLGRNGCNVANFFFGGDFNRLFADFFRNGFGGDFDTAFEQHRVGASGQGLQTFGHDGMRQNSGGGGAVAGDIVGLGRSFFEELSAHIFKRVLKFNFFCNGHAIVGDGGGTEFAIQGYVAAFRAQGGGYSGSDNINAVF